MNLIILISLVLIFLIGALSFVFNINNLNGGNTTILEMRLKDENLNDGNTKSSEIRLEDGDINWSIYVDGRHQIWYLKYKSYDELPVHNGDYGQKIIYQQKIYLLQRVWSNQIQVASL